MRGKLVLPWFILGSALQLSAQQDAGMSAIDFAKQVEPILKSRCYACHAGAQPSAQLHLDVRSLAVKGGISGPVIIAGNSRASRLIHRVLGDGAEPRMPLGGAPLPAEEIAVLTRWIDEGAKWPDALAGKEQPAVTHWAYVKPVRPSPPDVKRPDWVRNPIDRFILARLEKEGLQPSPEASRETLIRRLSLDLIGLPPSPAEIDAFLNDRRPDAYERLVDRLFASPHYGERWAQPWLDLARYADSNGYEKDRLRSAWPYRDWVIRALNENKPFDQFTIEQIAGDLLPNATTDQKVATGFLRNSMTNQEAGVDPEESNWNEQIDRAITLSTTWLGSTMGCAECHNHKFDPFTQKQFYQLVAFFNNVAFVKPTRGRGAANGPSYVEPQLELPTPERARARDQIKSEMKKYEDQINETSPKFLRDEAEWEQKITELDQRWQPLKPLRMTSMAGSILTSQADGSVFVSGPTPAEETFVVEAKAASGEISAIRIEALPDSRLPRSGPGRDYYGNFVVTQISVEQGPAIDHLSKVEFTKILRNDPAPTNNHPYAGGPPVWAVDASRDTVRVARQLLLIPERPIQNNGGLLHVTLAQRTGIEGQSLGRFRVSVISTPTPELEDIPARIRPLLAIAPEQRMSQQREQVYGYYRIVDPELAPVREKLDGLQHQLDDLHIPVAPVMAENPGIPRPSTNIRMSGSFVAKGEIVDADVPSFLGALPADAPPNRLGLAKWLVSRDNPLTARVAANHIWQGHFGRGLVETAEDFGTQGSRPSYPELLDWLAAEFMDSGWNVKVLHRLIVTSSTYRQSSRATSELLDRDPANVLLARGARYRVEAETVRDIALAASGLLSPKIGGPSVMPFQPDGVWDLPLGGNLDKWQISPGEDRYRRGLYTVLRRTAPYPSMSVFDAPSREFCTARRPRSDTPLQALTTLNDPVFFEAAQAMAKRIRREGGKTDAERAAYGFRLVTAQRPDSTRLDSLLTALRRDRTYFERNIQEARGIAAEPDPDLAAWTMLSRVLLSLDATLTKD